MLAWLQNKIKFTVIAHAKRGMHLCIALKKVF
jgi:hypothetical protein